MEFWRDDTRVWISCRQDKQKKLPQTQVNKVPLAEMNYIVIKITLPVTERATVVQTMMFRVLLYKKSIGANESTEVELIIQLPSDHKYLPWPRSASRESWDILNFANSQYTEYYFHLAWVISWSQIYVNLISLNARVIL